MRVAGLITPTGNDDRRALLGEGNGGSAADAAQAAGDQDDRIAHDLLPVILPRPYRQSMAERKRRSAFEIADSSMHAATKS